MDEQQRTAAGTLIEASWIWQRAGNAMHASWDNTTLGRITVTADMMLKLDVNSAGRAARGRPIVELGQRTPREAVKDRDGREAVAALIAQLERDGARHVPPLDAAIPTMLRRELGLT